MKISNPPLACKYTVSSRQLKLQLSRRLCKGHVYTPSNNLILGDCFPTCLSLHFPECNLDATKETYNQGPSIFIHLKKTPLPPFFGKPCTAVVKMQYKLTPLPYGSASRLDHSVLRRPCTVSVQTYGGLHCTEVVLLDYPVCESGLEKDLNHDEYVLL